MECVEELADKVHVHTLAVRIEVSGLLGGPTDSDGGPPSI